mmetsp:Transcript_107599/g.299211  ORF Transcript_107599/g.299211 Transcript_107599/m.299211 type:complete len:496 (-) Transcript_107599:159-1646(-)
MERDGVETKEEPAKVEESTPDPDALILARERTRVAGRDRMRVAEKALDCVHDVLADPERGIVPRVMRRLMSSVPGGLNCDDHGEVERVEFIATARSGGASNKKATKDWNTAVAACGPCKNATALHDKANPAFAQSNPRRRGADVHEFNKLFMSSLGNAVPPSIFASDALNVGVNVMRFCRVWQWPGLAWTASPPAAATGAYAALLPAMLEFQEMRNRVFGHPGGYMLDASTLTRVLRVLRGLVHRVCELTADDAEQPDEERAALSAAEYYLGTRLKAEATAIVGETPAVRARTKTTEVDAVLKGVRDEVAALVDWLCAQAREAELGTAADLPSIRDACDAFRAKLERQVVALARPRPATTEVESGEATRELVEHVVFVQDTVDRLFAPETLGTVRGGGGDSSGVAGAAAAAAAASASSWASAVLASAVSGGGAKDAMEEEEAEAKAAAAQMMHTMGQLQVLLKALGTELAGPAFVDAGWLADGGDTVDSGDAAES